MKREHFLDGKNIPEPIYYFPLTENTDDVMGNFTGWTTDNLSQFGENGAYFNGMQKLLKNSTGNTFANFQTYSMKIMLPNLLSDVYMLMIIRNSSNTNINLMYAPSWSQDVNFSVYVNGSYGVGSIESVPFAANTEYTLSVRQNFDSNTTDLFVNGTRRGTAQKCQNRNSSVSDFSIGYNYAASNRYFYGYIRDLFVFDTALTDEEIRQL